MMLTGEANQSEVVLPSPEMNQKPLLQLIQKRESSRNFSSEPLSLSTLSNILYAAYGVTRPRSGKRAAPSAFDGQYIEVFVTDATGAYRFNAQKHSLEQITTEDIRGKAGTQEFTAIAAVNLVYVLDESKIREDVSDERRMLFGGTTTGAIAQNVYLYCAAEGLHTVVREGIDLPVLHEALKLRPDQKILLSQTIGHPTILSRAKGVITSLF